MGRRGGEAVATNNAADDGVKVLRDIPVKIDVAMVLQSIKSNASNRRIETELGELVEMVLPVVRPKVMYKVAQVTLADGKRLEVDGCEFTHHVPSLSFSHGERVFPYVATCGLEVESIKFPDDLMKDYCLNVLKNVILTRAAVKYFEDYLKQTYLLQELSRIGPGEAMGSTSQQAKLFSLIGDVEGAIGVRLSAHNMMVPEKSVSGIFFETAVRIESCQLCPNDCRARRAPHDPELFKTFRKKG
jgi:hypothetical protein